MQHFFVTNIFNIRVIELEIESMIKKMVRKQQCLKTDLHPSSILKPKFS